MSDIAELAGIPTVCFWCSKDCGGTCLELSKSTQMSTSDPAYWMLKDGRTSTTEAYEAGCYICEDPEFAQMGLPLCKPCAACQRQDPPQVGHVPADDVECTVCGADAQEEWAMEQERIAQNCHTREVG